MSYEGIQRVESYMIPQDAMREVILNAIAHKYYPSGNPIQIKVYDDHITAMNEGFWPFDRIDVKDVYDKEHSSYPINPLIAEGIYTGGDIETWGTGFNKIKSACNRYGCPLPTVEATSGSITIVIKASQEYLELLARIGGKNQSADSTDTEKVSDVSDNVSDVPNDVSDLNEREKQILSVMVKNREYSSDEISHLVGLKSTRTKVLLRDMKDKGFVESTGTTNGNRYIRRD